MFCGYKVVTVLFNNVLLYLDFNIQCRVDVIWLIQ